MTNEVNMMIQFYRPEHGEKYRWATGGDQEGVESYINYMKHELKGNETFDPVEKKIGNYKDYMDKRIGSNGIWRIGEDKTILPVPQGSTVWDIVISLDEDMTGNLRLASQDAWNDALKEVIPNMLIKNNMNPDHYQIVAAFHNNTGNHHCHLRINQLESEEYRIKGKLLEASIKAAKAHIYDKAINSEIEWNKVKLARDEMRVELRKTQNNNAQLWNNSIKEAKAIIDHKTTDGNNARLSYASFKGEDKILIDNAFDNFVKSFPEFEQSLNKNFESVWKEVGTRDEALAKTQLEDIHNRIKNEWIQMVATGEIKSIKTPAAKKVKVNQKKPWSAKSAAKALNVHRDRYTTNNISIKNSLRLMHEAERDIENYEKRLARALERERGD